MPRSEEQPDFVGYCVCNCPIYEKDGKRQYTCDEAPCWPRDGDLEEGEDEAEEREAVIKRTISDIKEGS